MIAQLEYFQTRLQAWCACIAKASMYIGGISCGLMGALIVLDVLTRALTGGSVRGAIELGELAMVFLVFGIFPYLQWKRGQMRVELIVSKMSVDTARGLMLFQQLLMVLLTGFLMGTMCPLIAERFQAGLGTPDLMLPIWPFMGSAALMLGCYLLVLLSQMLKTLLDLLRERRYGTILIVLAATLALMALPALLKGSALLPPRVGIGAIGFVLVIVLLLLGLPIGASMGVVGCLGLLLVHKRFWAAMSLIGGAPYTSTAQYVLAVMPMFILMGEICAKADISRDLFRTAHYWVGHFKGGLAMAAILGCAGFAAVCGESLATAVTMCLVALPEMRRQNYNPGFACCTLASGGTLGILIPPSTTFIWYAILTEQSVGRLFMAGVFPGLLLTFLFILAVKWSLFRNPSLAPSSEPAPWSVRIGSLSRVLPMLGVVLFCLMGIIKGFFSPTEGGAMGAFGALLYAFASRRLSLKGLWDSFVSAAEVSGQVIFIMIGVTLLGFFLAATQLPQSLAGWIQQLGVNRYVVFAMVCLLYIFLGMLLNVLPMMLLTIPAIFPMIVAVGFDPVWFGAVMVILCEMSLITPPVGMIIFSMSSVGDVPVEDIYRHIIPFFLAMAATILLITIFPEIVLWLPNSIFGR